MMAEAEVAGSGEFAERMVTMANEAMLALMVSIGHRTGLFDVMAGLPAATSQGGRGRRRYAPDAVGSGAGASGRRGQAQRARRQHRRDHGPGRHPADIGPRHDGPSACGVHEPTVTRAADVSLKPG